MKIIIFLVGLFIGVFLGILVVALMSAARSSGVWTFDPLAGDWICSECDLHSMEHGKYCPNCGAMMER